MRNSFTSTNDNSPPAGISARPPLERWRSEGIGPRFLKLGGRVLYR